MEINSLLQAYLEWRAVIPEGSVYLSLGPIAAAVISSLVPVAVDAIFGDKSGGGAAPISRQTSALEQERLRQQNDLFDQIKGLIEATPSAAKGLAEAGFFKMPRSLAEARDPELNDLASIFGAINFDAQQDIEQLMQLLGALGSSTAASQQAGAQQFSHSESRDDAFASLAGDIVVSLLNRPKKETPTVPLPPIIGPFGPGGIGVPTGSGGNG